MPAAGIVSCSGYFTMLSYLVAGDAEELARRLGYDQRRLSKGFRVVALAEDELLAADDFELRASSRWSGGVLKTRADGNAWGVENTLDARDQDVARLRLKVAAFFARRGLNTPAKVLPHSPPTPEDRYPDAEALGPGLRSGVPQFELLKPRRFIVLRSVG